MQEEEGGCGWAVTGEIARGLNIWHEVALAEGLQGTKLLDQINHRVPVEDEIYNPYHQERNRLESLELALRQ